MERAWSLIEVKSLDEEERIISGVASSIATDRMGDIVEPKGASYKLPMPLLWQHKADQPVGWVEVAERNDEAISFKARMAKIAEPGPLKQRIDTAWQSVKAGLVRGVSIGFRVIDAEWMKDADGMRFKKWEWLELSLVTIPANQDASIEVIRSIDAEVLAVSGKMSAKHHKPPGVSGCPKKEKRAMATIAEQILSFAAQQTAAQAKMDGMMADAAAEGRTLDVEEGAEYENLKATIVDIEKHIERLREREKVNITKAVAVADPPKPSEVVSERRSPITVKPNVPKGTAFTRYAIALMRSKGNLETVVNQIRSAPELASWRDQTPEVEQVLRAAVAAGTTTDATWAGPLVNYQVMANEFAELLRGATIIGRIPGLRTVPFLVKVPRQTAGASAGWVGEGAPKPLSKLAFDAIQLPEYKAAVIVVQTEELVRFSNPSSEEIVRNDMIAAIAEFLDKQFLDPAITLTTGIRPASITNGITGATPSGTTIDAARKDLAALVTSFATTNHRMSSCVWVMTPAMAATLSLGQTITGQPTIPGITPQGGSLYGFPVVTSTNIVPGSTGSRIFLIEASEILYADSGTMLDVSREASVQMNDAPDNPATATTVLVSLWQNNLVGIRAERYIAWLARRTGSVAWIENAAYTA